MNKKYTYKEALDVRIKRYQKMLRVMKNNHLIILGIFPFNRTMAFNETFKLGIALQQAGANARCCS